MVCAATAKLSWLDATEAEVGLPSAISRAKLGPERQTRRWCACSGSTSPRIWLTSRQVPTSMPFDAEMISAPGRVSGPACCQTSRTAWLGTTESTTSLSSRAAARLEVAPMFSGSRTWVR